MKKTLFTIGLAVLAALSFTNCSKEQNAAEEEVITSKNGTPFELFATPTETKTTLDGMAVKWVGGDAINIFHAVHDSDTYVKDDDFTIAAGDVATGKFTGELTEAPESGNTYDWYAFYPYVSAKLSPAAGTKGWTPIGSKTSETQEQEGNDSKAHIVGTNYPLYGKVTNVAYNVTPTFAMEHLCAYIEFIVTNNSGSALTVTDIEFTSTEDIIGTYYIGFNDPSNIDYQSSGVGYTSSTATLEVTGGSSIADGSSAKFYMGIKPHTITASVGSPQTITVSVNGYEKELSLTKNTTFTAGKIKKINFDFDDDPSSHANATFVFNTTAGLSELSISAPSASAGTTLSGGSVESNDIALSFAKGTAGTDIRVWNSKGTYDLRSYTGNSITVTPPAGFNVKQIILAGSSVNGWSSSPSGFSSGTWSGDASSVVLTASSNGNINTITVKCDRAPVVPTIADATVSDAAVQGGVGLTKDIVLSNFDSAPSLTATPDGSVITAASVGSITTSGATVTYTLAPNYSGAAAEGTILIDDGAGHTGTVTVNQLADTFTVTRTELNLDAPSGSTTTITVKSDYDWVVVDDLIAGFTVSPSSFTYSGTQSQTVTITATGANATASPVELGAFTFKRSGDNAETSVITVNQNSAKLATPSITLTGNSSTKKISVSWGKNNNAAKYSYYVLDEDTNVIVDDTETADNTTTSFEFTVDYDVEYFVYVKCVGNNSPWLDSEYADDSLVVTEGEKHELLDFTAQGYSNAADVTSLAGSVATATFDKNEGTNGPKYYTSSPASVRTYAKNTLTVSVTSGKKITKIVFTLGGTTSASVTAGSGTLGTISSSSRTWTASGDVSSVVFTNGASGQMHYQKVDVYYQ